MNVTVLSSTISNPNSSVYDGVYEKLEGLEQLRFLENKMKVKLAKVDYGAFEGMSGVDSPEDVQRAEELFKKYGEF